jgi:hypothetical protein
MTFEVLVEEFIKKQNIDVEKFDWGERGDGAIGNYFANEEFKDDWIEFHNRNANLSVVSAKANVRRLT